MEKERRIKTLSLVALIVAVLGLTVAFAALSQTLTINGSASINSASWDVHFENQKVTSMKGYAQASAGDITNGGDTLDGVSVSLKQPRDSATIEVEIVNDGSIDAEIEDIQAIEDESNSNVNVWDYLEFDWYYEDGDDIYSEKILKAKESVKILMTFTYSDSVEDVLSESASWIFSIKLIYRQSDQTGSTGIKKFVKPTSSELASMRTIVDEEMDSTYYIVAEASNGDMISYSPSVQFSDSDKGIALISIAKESLNGGFYFLESSLKNGFMAMEPNIMYLVVAGSTSGSETCSPYHGAFPFNDSDMTIYSQSYYEYVKGLFE